MSAEDKKVLAQASQRNAFWPCLAVFVCLACEHGFGLVNLLQQHQQLQQTRAFQDQNLESLYQAKQLGNRVQALSIDLLAVAKTNAAAKQIVQDFGIKWTPDSSAPSTSAPATNQGK